MLHSEAFSAWITVDGKETTEYDVKTSEVEKTVTCYIASQLGKKFVVNWTNAAYRHPTMGSVEIDGDKCGGIVMHATHRGTLPETICHNGILTGNKLRPFKFGSLELTDDEAFDGESHHAVTVLTIEAIEITERRGGPFKAKSQSLSAGTKGRQRAKKVHERSKKAAHHRTTLGKAETLSEREEILFIKRTAPGKKLAKFVFQYRPLAILRAGGIAPMPDKSEREPSAKTERPEIPDEDLEKIRVPDACFFPGGRTGGAAGNSSVGRAESQGGEGEEKEAAREARARIG
ncbi:hypothetical protein B0H17DRAFT_1144620 [Mycena rosella]|uniref:DUF7918 domain-containing protein n=1 Tax=Mycena rosella TaxID=1033263 RepID=A0AAD7G367_MYCRO|nr:hypothetical protein B0H17DRAFT_1144620 [Mycena rosella]